MVEWLVTSSIADAVVVGLLVLLISVLVSGVRHRRSVHQLTTGYERQVQMLQQAVSDRNQEAHAQKAALTHAGNRLNELERELAQRVQTLRATEAQLVRAQEAEQQLSERMQEAANLRDTLQAARKEATHWQTTSLTLQRDVAEKSAGLEERRQEIAHLQAQFDQLKQTAEEQRAALAQIKAEHEHELNLRQSITAEISTLYHRLQSGTVGAPAEFPPLVAPSVAAHDAMDSDVPSTNGTVPAPPEVIPALPAPSATNGSKRLVELNNRADVAYAAHLNEAQWALVHFLAARGITVTQIPNEESFDPVLNALAGYLGTHYESVKPLYQQIKRNMQLGDDFTLNLKDESPKTISLICQFGRKLYDVAFLEQYRYFRSPQYLLRAKTTRLPTAQNFFSGQWLERFIMQEVQSAVNALSGQDQQQPDFAYIANPRITLANEQEGELDLLCTINGRIYWIESKSGDYQQHISKYAMIARTLQLDEKHALMVLTDIPASRSAELTALFGMGVCALGDFRAQLLASLQQELHGIQ